MKSQYVWQKNMSEHDLLIKCIPPQWEEGRRVIDEEDKREGLLQFRIIPRI